MNLFILDSDLDKSAEYHIDRHVGKMQMESAQLLTTAIWIDKYLGYIPDRKLTSEELAIIKEAKAKEPSIDERKFTRYLPTHINHPCEIWVRSSLDNWYYTFAYCAALNSEAIYRGYKDHDAFNLAAKLLPEPRNMKSVGLTEFKMAMPLELQSDNVIESYRLFYHADKAAIPATWKVRGKPHWWNEEKASYDIRYTEMTQAQKDMYNDSISRY